MPSRRSRVHPRYKTKYCVGNWAAYDRALVRRRDITLWISDDAIEAWRPSPTGRRGGQRKFADVAIETALVLRLVFHLPLRQTEGFSRSLLHLAPAQEPLDLRSLVSLRHAKILVPVAPAKQVGFKRRLLFCRRSVRGPPRPAAGCRLPTARLRSSR